MADKDKAKGASGNKTMPKDVQVIMAIMKEMGITEYDPSTVLQLTEFVYRYASTILEDARGLAVNTKKKVVDVEDVRTALQLSNDSMFVSTPPREVLTECARIKNAIPLPMIKPHCGLRLPADRYCLTTTNCVINSTKKNKSNGVGSIAGSGIKIVPKPTVSYVKRTTVPPLAKQTVSVPKPLPNVTVPQMNVPKAKIQIQQSDLVLTKDLSQLEIDSNTALKRKREDDESI